MGKANRLRQQRTALPPETREPEEPRNWPHGHVDVDLTGDEAAECIAVTIHDVRHYLHSSTAQALLDRLEERISEWDEYAKSQGAPGVRPQIDPRPPGMGPFDSGVISDDLARARVETRDMVRGTLGMFGPRNEVTEGHFPLLGFIERAQAFSLGAIAMLESGNPLGAATLLRSLAENVATAFYVNERPTELQKLQPGANHAPSVGRIVASAEKSLTGFKSMYGTLSSMAHPSGVGTFNTLKVAEDGTFTWQSYPTFKDDEQAKELLGLLGALVSLSTRVIRQTVRQYEETYDRLPNPHGEQSLTAGPPSGD